MQIRYCASLIIALCVWAGPGWAELSPETPGRTVLAEAGDHWFLAKSALGAGFLFDAATGEMQGTLSLTPFTPTIEQSVQRGEIYAAEIYYTRLHRGERNDVLTVYEHDTLNPVAEIDIPDKIASLNFPEYLSLLSDGRLLTIFNMSPAQSVSVVDVRRREFLSEIDTSGCALTMAVDDRGFLMMCGDGTLQLIRLGSDGRERSRVRSEPFFSAEDDPIFDQPVRTLSGWQLLSFEGQAFEAWAEGDDIEISEPWMLLSEEDQAEGWRIGGGQIAAVHQSLDLLFTLMHQGGVDTHETPGTEVWVFDRATQMRIARIVLEELGWGLLVTQSDEPLLVVSTAGGTGVTVYDIPGLRKVRSIAIGQNVGLMVPYR